MPVEFLSDEQVAAYGRFGGPLARAQLERYFFLDDVDRKLVDERRGDHNRLGFAVQLGIVRFLGTFLSDPLDVPGEAVAYVADQLRIADPSCFARYGERLPTQHEHAREIRREYGYRDFSDATAVLREFPGLASRRVGCRALARYGLSGKAPALRNLADPRRTATLVAVVRSLELAAVDDALDLFDVLMASRLLARAERESARERLRALPRFTRASAKLAAVTRVLLDAAEIGGGLSVAQVCAEIERVVPRAEVEAALEAILELAPASADEEDDVWREELVKRYATVRPFLRMLSEVVTFGAVEPGRRILDAVRRLPELVGRKRVRTEEVSRELVTGIWRRLVFENPYLEPGVVDHRAYTFCVLEQLHRALRRRDVFAIRSERWADPRAQLLSGETRRSWPDSTCPSSPTPISLASRTLSTPSTGRWRPSCPTTPRWRSWPAASGFSSAGSAPSPSRLH